MKKCWEGKEASLGVADRVRRDLKDVILTIMS